MNAVMAVVSTRWCLRSVSLSARRLAIFLYALTIWSRMSTSWTDARAEVERRSADSCKASAAERTADWVSCLAVAS